MVQAVLTGDIVNSTYIDPELEKKLISLLQSLLSSYKNEFFRGDSFQVYMEEAEDSLRVALLCRTTAISLIPESEKITSDVRISIGLGHVSEPIESLSIAKGEAFVLSGRALDDLEKKQGRLIISCENKAGRLAFEVMSDYINSIFRQMTQKQAEVFCELLQGKNQQDAADKLKKSKSTISQHVSAGRWDEIEKILDNYRKMIQLLSL